jgi:serine/threonine protein kinase/Tol biopolymer transport system component
MSLTIGSRLGPYEIVVPLGAGGMGDVYRAKDTKLARDAALKILPGSFTNDPERVARFRREAQVLASLNHPHIAQIYGLEEANGTQFLVLELVDGESLDKRIARGPIPVDEALGIATQIAEALEAAHEKGIIHRDLKPANIALTKDGSVKVLDFGLAKVVEATSGSLDAMNSPTITSPAMMTGVGVILGTAAYMAPEQAKGRPADKRSDIWAFGCVLYEMLSGERPFVGDNVTELIASIVKDNPAWNRLPTTVPRSIHSLLRQCLAKDPRQRLRDIGDARLDLDEPAAAYDSADLADTAARHWRERVVWLFVAVFVGAIAWTLARADRSVAWAPIHRTSILPPAGMSFSPHDFAVSPDGRKVAFVTIASDGRTGLSVRSLDTRGAQQLNDTDAASYPFWAPDSRRLGFFAAGQLKVADTATGGIQSLSAAPNGRGGTWNRAGVIVFAPDIGGPLYRISERGGRATNVTAVDAKTGKAHRWPWFLPDQNHFLFFEDWGIATDPRPSGLYAGSLDGRDASLISASISGSVEYVGGYLLYVQDASLMAQPFDAQRLRLSGTAVPILDQELGPDLGFGHGNYSASLNGIILFQSLADAVTELVWCAADGKRLDDLKVSIQSSPSLSPDGRLLAFPADESNGRRFIRIYDRQRGVVTNLTTGGREDGPVWSKDGTVIAYFAKEGEQYSMYEIPASGAGTPKLLLSGARMTPTDYSADGRYLLFMTFEAGPPQIAFYDRLERRAMISRRGAEGQYSPDGRWLAFASAPSEVFIQSVKEGGPRVQVSNSGGGQPRWSHDGKRLFYLATDRKLMEVTIGEENGHLTAGVPRPLFQTQVLASAFAFFQYDATQDASRFVINSLRPGAPLTLVSNWTGLLGR